ncbi:DUF2460 domain-containing protein [Thiobacillus sp. 65-1402]|uniref:DUF2460 domain-containing protein n=1 Tax=Thiobacillus sp. 65-1402 TaxID=1895861 RepID=UPI0025D3E4C0|nr:DUF2460 domain-containing protein [Thiobacillus sp. 65-1402]
MPALPPFIETVLPVLNNDFGTVGGPQWRTGIIEKRTGHEQRNIDLDDPRREWSMGERGMLEADLDALLEFHTMVRGAAIGFRFLDQADHKASTKQLLGFGTGALATFQLVKHYGESAYEYVRPITKPIAGTVAVYVDDVLQASGWTLDAATGIVTFAAAPALDAVVKATFQFHVPVRFKEDRIRHKFEMFTNDGKWFSVSPVTLIELPQ